MHIYCKSSVDNDTAYIGVMALKELREKYLKYYLPPLKGANVAKGRTSQWAEDNSTVRLPESMGLSCYGGDDLRDDCGAAAPVCQGALEPATVTSPNDDVSICKMRNLM